MAETVFLSDPQPTKPVPRSSRAVVALLLLAGLVFVAGWVVLLAVILFGYRGGINNGGLPAVMPPVAVETLEEKQADLQAGFGSDAPAVDAATLQEFQAYFDKVSAAAEAGNWLEYANLIDLERFVREIKKTGLVREMTRKEEWAQLEKFRLEPPGLTFTWKRMAIANAKMLDPGNQEAVVYVFLWNSTEFALEYRVWLARTAAGWKAYDWEFVPFGFRSSFEKAACIKGARDPRLLDYFAVQRDISSADQKEDAGDNAAAVKLLQQAEARARLPELADRQLIELGYAWWRARRAHDGLRCAAAVNRPEAVPGALFLQATLYDDLRQYRRAVEFAQRYEKAAGGGPAVWQILAAIYQRQGDRAQAARYWRKLLQFDSENVATLYSFAAQLEPGEFPTLIDALHKTGRPAELAAELAERMAWTADTPVMQALSEFVAGREPDSARAAYLAGLTAESDGDLAAAAGFYKSAWQRETDADRKSRYTMKFLDAMTADDQALAGYQQAPDPQAAFEHLLSDDDDEGSSLRPAVQQALIDAHRLRFPDSPKLHYQAGRLLQETGDDEEAEREFKAAMATATDDDDRQQSRSALVELLRQAGRDVEAYQTVAPSGDTFRQLVQSERWSEGTEKLDVLKELDRLHQATYPNDGWLNFCEALIQQREKNTGEALRLAVQGYERATDQALKSNFQWLVLDLATLAGDFASAGRVFANPDEALERLGQRFMSQGEWDRLKALLDWHRTTHGDQSPMWRRHLVAYAWNRSDCAGVIDAVDAAGQSSAPGRAPGETSNYDDWYVRSLLKLGRADDARRKAQSLFDDGGAVLPLLLVNLAARNLDEVKRLMAQADLQPFQLQNLYDDSDAGPILYSPEFQEVRRDYPPAVSYWLGSSSAVLLVRQPPALTAASLKAAADAVLTTECAVELLEPVAGNSVPGRTAQWLIVAGTARLLVGCGSAPYHDAGAHRRQKVAIPSVEQSLAAHQGWIEVEQIGTDRGVLNRKDSPEFLRLAAALLTDDCRLMYLPERNRLIENSAELRQALASENSRDATARLGLSHWLQRRTEENRPGAARRGREFQKSLKRMTAALRSRRPEQKFEVVVAVNAGSAAELLPIDLDGIKPGGFRGMDFVGTLRRPSKFLPRLTTGERVTAAQYLIVELSYDAGDKVEQARRND
jgi:hypothetical protein